MNRNSDAQVHEYPLQEPGCHDEQPNAANARRIQLCVKRWWSSCGKVGWCQHSSIVRYTVYVVFWFTVRPFFGFCLWEKRNPEDTSRRNVDEQDLMGDSLTVSYSGCLLEIWRFIQRSQSQYGKESWTGSRIYIMDMTHARWLKRFTKSASLSRSALPFSAKAIFWHCCSQILL